jgi:D-amino-acid dehydrogenase
MHCATASRIVVIGGGVIGVTTAAALASRGLQVTLLERAESLGSGVTARNGAQLSYCYADALGTPALLSNLPRLLAGLDPSFRVHKSVHPDFLRWAFRFLMNCRAGRFLANTRAVFGLAARSRAALADLLTRHPELQFQHTKTGKLHLYDTADKFAAAKLVAQFKRELGCQQRVVSAEETIEIEPAVAAAPRKIVGAIYSPQDEAGDPYQFTQALGALVARKHGVRLLTSTVASRFVLEGRSICAVETSSGLIEGDLFVLAAGSESAALARGVGVRLPIFPMKGYSITLPITARSPIVSITDSRARIVFCRLQNEIRIAGLAELGRTDNGVDPKRVRILLDAARASLPEAADWHADPCPWSGLRPMTPDCRPIIGAAPSLTNLVLNCGHGMLGWTLACGSAELTASIVLHEDANEMADDFALARFVRSRVSTVSSRVERRGATR